jgi:SPP1 gp7 family putative phage head morphogenesis protein
MLNTIDKYSDIIALTLLKAEEQEREDEAQAFRAVVTDNEFKFFLDLRSMFKAQEKEVLSKLNALKDMADMFMFDYAVWERNLKQIGNKHMTNVSTENGRRVFDDLKRMSKRVKDLLMQTSYDMTYPETLEYLDEQSIKLAGTVTTTTEEQIRAQLTNGFVEGLTVDEIAANISRVFTVASGSRAKMIARTEMSRAANYGAVSAYKQSGVVEAKEWLTAQDEKVCPYCNAMDKKVESLSTAFLLKDQTFEGDDGTMMTNNYLDVQAPPLHISCRCSVLPVVKEFVVVESPKYIPEQTLQGAENWALNNVAKQVNFKGLDLDVANKINKTLHELIIINKYQKLDRITTHGGFRSYASASGNDIYINRAMYKKGNLDGLPWWSNSHDNLRADIKKIEKRMQLRLDSLPDDLILTDRRLIRYKDTIAEKKKALKTIPSVPYSVNMKKGTIHNVISHEYGHTSDNRFLRRKLRGLSSYEGMEVVKAHEAYKLKTIGSKKNLKHMGQHISEYGSTTPDEAIAEAWNAYHSSKKKNLSKTSINYIEKLIKSDLKK